VRWLISFVLVAVTVVLQLTVVDRIAFPGGAGPNLVLLVVVALALAGGPLAGVLIGFLAGLALDVAPPGSHFVGQDALVFCLIGYACGLLADDSSGDIEQGHTALFEIMVTAAGVICGEALAALLGVMLSDPRVTWPAITHVLPVAVAYDVLLCPFVLYAVAAALRLAGARGEDRRVGWSASQARTPVPGSSQGAIRQLAAGNGPRLRLSERDRGTGSIGGLRGPGAGRPTGRREPQLKLGRAGQRTSAGLGGAFAPAALGAGPPRVRFGGRRRAGVLGGSQLRGAGSGAARRRSAGLGGARFGSSSMGRSLLGGSVFSRSSASPFRHRGNLVRPAGGGLAGRAPRFSRGGSLTRLTGALRRSGGPKSPGRGWLRGASSRGRSLGRGGLSRGGFGRRRMGRGPASLSRAGTPRLRMPRPKTRRKWRTGGYR
jgi:rod shape-determining protein MreD